MNDQTATPAILRSPFLLLAAALVALAGLFAHSALPALAQQSASLTLSVAGSTVAETAGSVTVTATLDQPAPSSGVRVALTPKSGDAGTAALGRDYTLPGPSTIAAGDTEASFRITINDDAVNERDETINLTASLSNAADATVTGVTITIQDNEESRMPQSSGSFSGYEPENVRVVRGDGALTITFDRAVLSNLTYWLLWRADDNPEWTTVSPVSSGYTLGNLVNGVLYHVRVTGEDGVHRGGWISASGTPITSEEQDANLTLSAGTPTVAETAGSVTVTATIGQPALTGGVQVTLTPKSGDAGTAALGRDYTLPETFTIAAGDTTAAAEVIINDDAVNERDETINLTATLGNVGAHTVTGATITIQDNEEYRSPPGSGSFSGYEPENVKAVPGHEELTVTFDRAVLSSLTFWLQWRADDNPEWTTVSPVSSGYTLGNLVNGVLYHVRVTGDDGNHRGGWVSTSGTPSIISFPPGDEIIGKDYTSGTDVAVQDAWRRDSYHAGRSTWQDSGPLPEAVTVTPYGASSVRVDYSATGLPAGLTLNADRMIVGTPAAVTSRQRSVVVYTATATVINADGSQGPRYRAARTFTFEIFVEPPVAFSAETIESLRTSTAVYDVAKKKWLEAGDDGKVTLPAASGGTGGLTYGLDDERSRPLTEVTAITFDSETRKIGGTPTALNTWAVTYWARDVNGVTAYAVTNVEVRAGGL